MHVLWHASRCVPEVHILCALKRSWYGLRRLCSSRARARIRSRASPVWSPTRAQRVPGPRQPEVVGAHLRHCCRTRFRPCFGRCGTAHCRATKWCLLPRALVNKLGARGKRQACSERTDCRVQPCALAITICACSRYSEPLLLAYDRPTGRCARGAPVAFGKLCTYLQRCASETCASTTLYSAKTCISRHVESGPR